MSKDAPQAGKDVRILDSFHTVILEDDRETYNLLVKEVNPYDGFQDILAWEDIDSPFSLESGKHSTGRHIIEGFLAYGLDINHTDEYGNTLLHQAFSDGDKNTVLHLIEYGADIHQKNHYGTKPFDTPMQESGIIAEKQKEILHILKSQGIAITQDSLQSYKESLATQFTRFGIATPEGIAFSLARQGIDAFQIYLDELSDYLDLVKKEATLTGKPVTRRFACYNAAHDNVGIIRIDGENVEFILLDSLAQDKHIEDEIRIILQKFPHTTIYTNIQRLQSNGPGCTIFSEELLEKLDKKEYFPKDLFAYAKQHIDPQITQDRFEDFTVPSKYIPSSQSQFRVDGDNETGEELEKTVTARIQAFSLPPRLIRSMYKSPDIILSNVPKEEHHTILDSKNNSIADSLNKHLDTTTDPDKVINRRLEHWLQKLHDKNWEMLEKMTSIQEIESVIKSRRFEGYQEYIEKLEALGQNPTSHLHQQNIEMQQLQVKLYSSPEQGR